MTDRESTTAELLGQFRRDLREQGFEANQIEHLVNIAAQNLLRESLFVSDYHRDTVRLTEDERDNLIRAFLRPDDDCAHNMPAAYAEVERIIAARLDAEAVTR
jgi:hypothetical protein